jgi:PleD family two-component response regulator
MTNNSDNLTEKNVVFIVDDQKTSRIIIESIAKTIDDNVEVKSFDNASDALIAAEESEPALILTDYKMPKMDGVEFIERLRKKASNEDVPIVIISALDDKEALYKALEAGAVPRQP